MTSVATEKERQTMNDLIARYKAIEAIENVDWYHQNRNKDMVSGANDDEHQAWYKADDIYKALEAIPSARQQEGKWIEVEWYPIAVPSKWCENDEKPIYASKLQCSKCGFARNFLDGHTAQYNFCPQCGADMREREGE